MQYILTQEEFEDTLKSKSDLSKQLTNKLQEACTLIADNVPVKDGWLEGKISGCILTEETVNSYGYCDDCLAKNLCPHEYKLGANKDKI